MDKSDAIIGNKVIDCVIKEVEGNEYTLECPCCHSLYTTTWKLMRDRKTPYCKCNIDPYSKIEDLRGQQFGDMLVLELDTDEERERILREKRGKHVVLWKCQCVKCGNISYKTKTELKDISKRNASGCNVCFGDNIIGKKFGRLLVLPNHKSVNGEIQWECECECGNKIWVTKGKLNSGNTRSCGCLQKDIFKKNRHKNGTIQHGGTLEYPRLYNIWSAMKARCNNPNNHAYKYYGGKGVKVDDKWNKNFVYFRDWALENGYRDDLTIDRIDVNGNYEPSNCRWTNYETQANNKSNNKMITYQGKTQSLADWCRELNLEYFKTKARLNTCHMTPEEAFASGYYKNNGKHELAEDRDSYKYH